MAAYYNEIDPGAAATLRELIRAGHIAPGDVDERSIEDVTPTELLSYDQCHFFAGAGIWSYALRLAGIPDDYPLWTGSCPCQPFSAAGKGEGFADERHLWPAFFHLIGQCGPELVFGEQVAGRDGLGWLDLVSTDLEAVGYTCGAVPAPATGFGAPHIRERLYWVADTAGVGRIGRRAGQAGAEPGPVERLDGLRDARGLADASGQRHDGIDALLRSSQSGRVGAGSVSETAGGGETLRPGPVNGYWRNADWLGCRDGKWRPVEAGTQPLAHGSAERVGRLRGASIQEHAVEPQEARVMRLKLYGNGLVAPEAAAFIEAYFDVKRIRLMSGFATDIDQQGVFG